MKYLRTNEIVVPQAPHEAQKLRSLVREGVVPNLVIARDEAGSRRPDVRSYTAALRQRGARILEASGSIFQQQVSLDDLVRIVTVPAADLRYIVRDANQDPDVDSVMVMSPTEREYDRIVAELSPGKDVDGMNPNSQRTPCTPRAIQQTLDFHGLWRPDLSYTLVGRGRTVNTYVDEALQEMLGDAYGDQVRVVTRQNEEDLPTALGMSDVAIVAAGVRNQIHPGMIHPDMKAVVGVCIEDIHPGAYDLPGDVLITPRHLDPVHMGIGALTAANALQQTLDAATGRLPS